MDKLIFEKKVDSILRCLNRIDDRIPDSEYDFLRDFDAQDVVILNLTRAVQLSVEALLKSEWVNYNQLKQ